ncbi:MAG TPA: PRC and DUF2382 domain-containing protein [Actinomycetes bacterium]|nr:PRC and DUF2382 domain-containing protein [Actinomycetes bacterium]
MDFQNNPQELMGRTVYGSDGEKIGTAGQVFVDDKTGQPEWLTVNTGLFGSNETFIPIPGLTSRGEDVAVAFDKETVKGAPNVDVSGGHLAESEEAELYRYYGLDDSYSSWRAESTERSTEGYDTSGPTTDDAMTVSEEQLRVGTEQREAGRVKLRKYVTTENVTQTVPVTREHVRLERESITDANVGDALSGPDISEEEHEMVLTEERPVVAKETVPVERVRLTKDVETEQVEVSEQVRKENIDVDDAIDVTENRQTRR